MESFDVLKVLNIDGLMPCSSVDVCLTTHRHVVLECSSCGRRTLLQPRCRCCQYVYRRLMLRLV